MRDERLIDIFYLKIQSIVPRPKFYGTRKEFLVGRLVCHGAAELDANWMYVAADATPTDRHCPSDATIDPAGRLFDLRQEPYKLSPELVGALGKPNFLWGG